MKFYCKKHRRSLWKTLINKFEYYVSLKQHTEFDKALDKRFGDVNGILDDFQNKIDHIQKVHNGDS